ncbi:hypothetical protein RchiOBHm_Chr7g0223831 [Rosa chinensis]|uniref:Uncharacterized protein n=1 Tax=Rosa chinensis TaxID=74649 RepID=A0A2P6PDN6_ROSCH|nr:hypothetical protein RchiOBHm_Chr7g0223831 [Rosa chinensis]
MDRLSNGLVLFLQNSSMYDFVFYFRMVSTMRLWESIYLYLLSDKKDLVFVWIADM